jgi:hypothetical protein
MGGTLTRNLYPISAAWMFKRNTPSRNLRTIMKRLWLSKFSRRAAAVAVALAIVAAGLYLGWGWLAAAGIAPILLALAPCVAMCGLGLCMNRMGSRSGSKSGAGKAGAPQVNT